MGYSIEYTIEVEGVNVVLDIDWNMGDIDNLRGGTEWGIEEWWITHVDGVKVSHTEAKPYYDLVNEDSVIAAIERAM